MRLKDKIDQQRSLYSRDRSSRANQIDLLKKKIQNAGYEINYHYGKYYIYNAPSYVKDMVDELNILDNWNIPRRPSYYDIDSAEYYKDEHEVTYVLKRRKVEEEKRKAEEARKREEEERKRIERERIEAEKRRLKEEEERRLAPIRAKQAAERAEREERERKIREEKARIEREERERRERARTALKWFLGLLAVGGIIAAIIIFRKIIFAIIVVIIILSVIASN